MTGRAWRAATAVACAVTVVAAGCGSSGDPVAGDVTLAVPTSSPGADTAQPDTDATASGGDRSRTGGASTGTGSSAQSSYGHGGSDDGSDPTGGADGPKGVDSPAGTGTGSPAPDTSLAEDASPLDVARVSVSEVVLLHNASVGLAHPSGLPGNPYADQADHLVAAFASQRDALDGATRAEVKDLRNALDRYRTLAGQVAAAAGSSSKKLPGSFVGALRSADASWKAAVIAIGDAAGVDLLVNLPPLLSPTPPEATVPPPPK